ncbi:hypothetical protein ACYU03_05625 [Pseudomonas sp. X10]
MEAATIKLIYALNSTNMLWQEVSIMGIKSRKCAVICALAAVVGLYATAAWRVEMLRNQPSSAASCSLAHCVPHTATLSAVR